MGNTKTSESAPGYAKESNVRPDLSTVPEQWEYNPSSWSQRTVVCLVALPAVLIASYMGIFQLGLIESVWDPVFGRQTITVLKSDVSHRMSRWFGIPDAILGALAYLGDILFALAGSSRRWQFRPWLVVLFGIDVIPLGIVSAILVVTQGYVIGAWCFLCLATAVISLALVVLAYDEVWSCLCYLAEVWRRSKSRSVVWRTFWGYPSEFAFEAGEAVIRKRRTGYVAASD